MKYRKKPVVIEAMQFYGDSTELILVFGQGKIRQVAQDCLAIGTLEGTMHARLGDYIIKGVAGEFYPCKPDIFIATYEPADDVMILEDDDVVKYVVEMIDGYRSAPGKE